jgi:alkyl hydroperoxide reductase subunit F
MYDLLIIGGGPAGLTAAVYAARKRLKTLLISENIGGQVNWTRRIENYLGYQFIDGLELIDKFQTQVSKYPIDQKIGYKVSRVNRLTVGYEAFIETGEHHKSRAVIFATGKKPKKLHVPGEEKFTGRGVSYCAICDGPLFSEQKVVVVGGGNSAAEAVIDLVKIADHVNLVSLTQLTPDDVYLTKLNKSKNLSIFTEYEVKTIKGHDFVNEITIRDLHDTHLKKLNVSGVFIEIGLEPNSESISELANLNSLGEITINRNCETSLPGLYAAGDVTDVPEKQIVVAAGEGAKAALQAHRYLTRLAD